MNLERDKFLTDQMGECYHSWKDFGDWSECTICHCKSQFFVRSLQENLYNFSTWEGFGKLWEWSRKQEWWLTFTMRVNHDYLGHQVGEAIAWDIVDPNNFAAEVADFLDKELPK